MLKLRFSYRKILEIIFTILVLILMSKRMTTQLYILSGQNPLFSNTSFYVVTVILFVILYLLNGINKNQVFFYGLCAFIICFLIIFVPVYAPSNLGTLTEIRNMLFSYLFVIMLFITLANHMTFKYKKEIIFTILVFCFLQSVLGIIQATFTQTIVPVEYNGESIVNTIYYLNGASSKNSYFLTLGARIRAFGMTDSGLTLSLFALLGLVLCSYIRKRSVRIFSILVFLVAIFLSYTRLVWLLTIICMLFVMVKKFLPEKVFLQILKSILVIGLVAQILLLGIVILNNFSEEFVMFPTLTSRLLGLNYYFQNLNLNFISVIFGQNFINRISEFNVYSLDNEILKVMSDIGLIGVIVMFYGYFSAFGKLVNKNFILLVFLSLFFLGGIGNVVYYFFIPVMLLAVLVVKKERVC